MTLKVYTGRMAVSQDRNWYEVYIQNSRTDHKFCWTGTSYLESLRKRYHVDDETIFKLDNFSEYTIIPESKMFDYNPELNAKMRTYQERAFDFGRVFR
jgi:hypothetical protein